MGQSERVVGARGCHHRVTPMHVLVRQRVWNLIRTPDISISREQLLMCSPAIGTVCCTCGALSSPARGSHPHNHRSPSLLPVP
jgi:hypothetical protein